MNKKPQLILDIGGVLLTNIKPWFWQELSVHAAVSHDILVGRYKREVSANLWSGAITEPEFWSWLCAEFPTIDEQTARGLLQASLKPLPALAYLKEWSRIADIHILSNHRMEWIEPAIHPLKEDLASITVSCNVGYSKPHPKMFEAAATCLNGTEAVLFVDDLERNLEQGILAGWSTLLADPDGKWMERVVPMLNELSLK